MKIPSLPPLRPAVKIGIVLAGFAGALAVAGVAMGIRAQPNAADPSQGMQAFGDMVLGLVVFTVLALPPLGLGLATPLDWPDQLGRWPPSGGK